MRARWCRRMILCLSCLLAAFIGSKPMRADAEVSVALLPLEVFSPAPDAQSFRRLVESVAAAALRGEAGVEVVYRPDEPVPAGGYGEQRARDLAQQWGGDWVLWGSLTQAGQLYSVDWRLTPSSGEKPEQSLYVEASSREQLLSKVEREMDKVLSRILERKKILEIRVEGNRRIGKDAILLRTTTRVGDDYSPSGIREDIREIDKLGYFDDVQVHVQDTEKGVIVTFLVKEKPTIREVLVTGNRKIDTKDIEAVITLQPGGILNYQALQDTVEKIDKLYQEKGYFAADVSYELKDLEGNQKGVVIRIDEGKKFWIKSIEFEGNEHFSDKELKKVMETKEKTWLSFIFGTGVLDQETLRQDVERISAYYYNHGYLRNRIGTPKIDKGDEWIYITIGVEEGDVYTVRSIDLEGDLLEDEELMKASLATREGEAFNRDQLRQDILKLTERYSDLGYAYVDIKPETKINEQDKTVGIDLSIARHEKVQIGRIRIVGNTKTRDKVIRRELQLAEGETFSSTALKESSDRLRALKYFEEVNITTSEGPSPKVMDLNVEVKEQQTGTFSLGAGYSSVDQLVGVAEIQQSNLFGLGYKVRLRAEVGSKKQFYDFSFLDPWFLDTRTSARLDLYNTEREYIDYTRASTGGDVLFSFPLDRYLPELVGTLGYRYESVDVLDVDEDASVIFKQAKGRSSTSELLSGLTLDLRDNLLYPSSGNFSQLTLDVAGFGGDNYFFKNILTSAQYFPLIWDTVFMARGEIGFGWGYYDHDLPVFERFFLGGLHSLRGFEAGSVGPRDPETGDVIGGDKELFFNFEYIFPVWKKMELRGVLFYDTGNAYLGPIDITDFRHAVGGGSRWNSPFGPIRIEVGYNLFPKADEDSYEFAFGMGGAF
jgi:outer membrane protein insertion porin family